MTVQEINKQVDMKFADIIFEDFSGSDYCEFESDMKAAGCPYKDLDEIMIYMFTHIDEVKDYCLRGWMDKVLRGIERMNEVCNSTN